MLEAAYNNNTDNNINYSTGTVPLGVNLSPDQITGQVFQQYTDNTFVGFI
jgi:hypothetical protein